MNRRTARGALGAAVLALLGLAVPLAGADDKPHEHGGHFAKCAKACAVCMLECESCQTHCGRLVLEGKKDHVKTMRLCGDCGSICATAAKITSRQGPLSVTLCDACAKACDTCGAACAKFPDDAHMAKCAKACKDCAAACREMIKHAGHTDKPKEE